MIERRLFYLQTRLDATPRSLPAGPAPTAHERRTSRIFRLFGNHGPRHARLLGEAR